MFSIKEVSHRYGQHHFIEMSSYRLVITLLVTELVLNIASQTSFGCKNAAISDEWRAMVMKWHNDNRRKVAQGKQITKNGAATMPMAKNMWELAWDCNLEHNAWLSICDTTITVPATYPITDKATLGRGKNCNITDKTKSALKKWWDEAVAPDLSADPKYDPATIKNFGRMASGDVKGFACTYNSCGTNGDTQLLCAYSAKVADNTALYTPANQDSDICVSCPQNKCAYYLCKDAYTPVADAEPKSQCPNNEDGMTYDMQTIALNAHNYYRRLTATGWAQDSKGYAPRAKKMEALKYECTTAGAQSKAQADDCTKIGQYAAHAGYSLNYATFDYTVSGEDALEKAIGQWFGQLKNVDLGEEAKYTNDIKTSAKDFANMVIGESTQIGCATKNCPAQGKTVVVCQYDKQPVEDDPLYEVGKPCSGCDKATRKCDPLGGLCITP